MIKKLLPALFLTLSGTLPARAQSPWAVAPVVPWTTSPSQGRSVDNLLTPAPGTLWGTNLDMLGASNFQHQVFASVDRGQSWQTATLGSGSFDLGGTGTYIANVEALDGQKAWALLENAQTRQSQLLRTSTGPAGFGAAPAPATTFLRVVRFFDPATGVLIRWDPNQSDKLVYRTTDGGATWRAPQVLPAPATDQLRSCVRVDQQVWVATSSGLVLHSADRGATWAAVPSGLGPALRAISFRDAQNGLALGTNNQVRRTADGGTTWTPVAASGVVRFTSVAAVPGSFGTYLSVGNAPEGDQNGTSLTTDDGATWQTLESTIRQQRVVADRDGEAWAAEQTAGQLRRYVGVALGTKAAPSRPLLGLYPNPATTLVRLAPSAQPQQVSVYDGTGRLRYQAWLRPGAEQFDVHTLAAGLYQVTVQTAAGTVGTGRLVIE